MVSSRESVSAISSIPIEGTLLPHVDVADGQNPEKNSHLYQAKDSQLAKINRPWVKKHDFQIKDQKQHRDQVKLHGETNARIAARRVARLERLDLRRVGGTRSDFPGDEQQR